MLTRADSEYLCRVGPGTPMGELFRRFWLPATLTWELPEPDGAPVRLRLLGEDLVLWRDFTGAIGAIRDACPHRGASMFFGRNEESGLRCVYHGWKFDTSGTCVDMPNEPAESNFKHKIRATAYPCAEYADIVWIYMGPQSPAPGLPQLDWGDVPSSHRYSSKWDQACNWAQGLEGNVDSSHVGFLHKWFDPTASPEAANAGASRFEDRSPVLTVKETEFGYVYGARRTTATGYYWRLTPFILPCYTMVPGPASPGYPRRVDYTVPMDDEHTWWFRTIYREGRPLEPELVENYKAGAFHFPRMIPGTWHPVPNAANYYQIDREMQRKVNFTGIFNGREQDMAIVETMGKMFDRTIEHLGAADTAIIAFRRLIMRLARQLEQGVEPWAPNHPEVFRVRSVDFQDGEGDLGAVMDSHRQAMIAPLA